MTVAHGGALLPGPFNHRWYVPILLTRQGERHALRVTPRSIKDRFTPLFVVHPVALDPQTGVPKKSVQEHLEKLAPAVVNDWGPSAAFVDLRYVDTSKPVARRRHAVAWFIEECAVYGLPLAPAISTTHNAAYRAAAVDAADTVGTSVMLRLGPSEWADLGSPLGSGRLLGLLAETRRLPSQVHLMFDIEAEVSATPAVTAAALRPALAALPHAAEWASVTVAGTGMPVGTAAVGRDNTAELPRLEWELWQSLSEPGSRPTTFGDYCVQHPDPMSDFNPLYMDSSAQLRYTIARSWFVARGKGMKVAGSPQIHALAKEVVGHPEYAGSGFSWGDDWLAMCAARTCKPGNQGVWRKVTTNHHLAFVVSQVATLPGP